MPLPDDAQVEVDGHRTAQVRRADGAGVRRSAQQRLARLKLLARADVGHDLMLHQRVAGRRRQAGDRPLQPQLELPPVGLRPIDVDVLGTPVAYETAGVRHLIGVVVVEVHNRRADALVGERGLDADVRRTRAFDRQIG